MRARLTGLWRHPDFLKLWAGDTISLFGLHATVLALPLTAVALGATAFQMGLLAAAQTAPALLLGLFAGVWVDRLRRRPILIAANLARAALLGSVPLAALLGVLHLAQLYAVAFLAGVGAIFFVVAYQAYLPAIVPREHLVDGNSKLRMSEATAQIAGPSIGGALVQLLSAPLALAAGAFASLGSAITLALIRAPEPAPGPAGGRAGVRREIGEGVRFVLGHPLVRPVLAGTTTSALFYHMIVGVYILYLTRDLGVSAGLLGAIVATGGPLAILGAAVTGRLVRRWGMGATLIGALVLSGAANLLVPLAAGPLAAVVPLLVAWRVLDSLAAAVYNVVSFTIVQAAPPPGLQGRVQATMRVGTWGAMAVGSLLGGALGQVIGLRPALAIAAAGMLLAPLWLVRSPVRGLRGGPEPAERGAPAAGAAQ